MHWAQVQVQFRQDPGRPTPEGFQLRVCETGFNKPSSPDPFLGSLNTGLQHTQPVINHVKITPGPCFPFASLHSLAFQSIPRWCPHRGGAGCTSWVWGKEGALKGTQPTENPRRCLWGSMFCDECVQPLCQPLPHPAPWTWLPVKEGEMYRLEQVPKCCWSTWWPRPLCCLISSCKQAGSSPPLSCLLLQCLCSALSFSSRTSLGIFLRYV